MISGLLTNFFSIINTGRYKQTNMLFSAEFRKPALEWFLGAHREGKPILLQLSLDDSYIELLDVEISIGPMVQIIKGVWEMSVPKVEAALEKMCDNDSLEVKLIDVEMFEEFENWLQESGNGDSEFNRSKFLKDQ